MPVFEYTGLTEAGKNVRGIRDAESSKVLRQVLRKDGVYLTDARAAEAGAVMGEQKTGLSREVDLGAMLGFTGVSTQDLAIATRQLATLIAAGIPLVDALTALVDQIEQPRLKRIMGVVKQKVNEGLSLADALREHPKVFSDLYVNMIRAGESSGALDVVLVLLPALVFGVRRYVRSPRGRAFWDRAKLRAPIFGELIRMLALSRFAKTLATLLASGVPLLTAM